MTEDRAPGRLRLQAIVVILAASLIGALVGVTAERAFNSRRPPPGRFADFGPRDPGRLPGPLGRLDLTEEQRTDIRTILEAWEPRTQAVMEEMMPRIRAVRDSVRIAIEAVLTPEQKEQLAERGDRDGWRDWGGGRRPGFRGRPGPGGRGFRPDSQ